MHGFVIEERPCGQCRNPRTVRFGAASFCFNCRSRGDDGTGFDYPFSRTQFLRLLVYRAAVRAGFYTDCLPGQTFAFFADPEGNMVGHGR